MKSMLDEEKLSRAISEIVKLEDNVDDWKALRGRNSGQSEVKAALPSETQPMLSAQGGNISNPYPYPIYPETPALPAFKKILSYIISELDSRFVSSPDFDLKKIGFRAGVAVKGSLARANNFWTSSLEAIVTPYVKARHWWEAGERYVSFFGTRRHVETALKKFSTTLSLLSIESKDLSPVLLGSNTIPTRLNVALDIKKSLAKDGWSNGKWEVLDNAPPAYRNDLAHKMIWPRLKAKLADAAGMTMTINALQRSDYWIARVKEVADASNMEVGALSYALISRPDWVAELPKGKELITHRQEILATADKYTELLQRVLSLSRAYVSSIDALTPYLKEDQVKNILNTPVAQFGTEIYSYAVFKSRVESIPMLDSAPPPVVATASPTVVAAVSPTVSPTISPTVSPTVSAGSSLNNSLIKAAQKETLFPLIDKLTPSVSNKSGIEENLPIQKQAPIAEKNHFQFSGLSKNDSKPIIIEAANIVSVPSPILSKPKSSFNPLVKSKIDDQFADDQFANFKSTGDDLNDLPEDDSVSTAFTGSYRSPGPKR